MEIRTAEYAGTVATPNSGASRGAARGRLLGTIERG